LKKTISKLRPALLFVLVMFILLSTVWVSSAGTVVRIANLTKGKAQQIQLYDYTVALIIGIDRYADFSAQDQLAYAVSDAWGVEKVLRSDYQFDEIITLYNEEATRDGIMAALYGFRTLSPDAGVFVYFAGHGVTIPGMIGGKYLGYLIPADGSLNTGKMFKNISMQQIKSDICTTIPAKHVFFVFDACFAGLMLYTRATSIKPIRDIAYLKSITKEQVRQVLTAGDKGQTVLDGGPKGHSVFTGRFIEVLENVDNYITASDLGQSLKKQVFADAAARGHQQRPVDGKIYGTGDFVFVPDLKKRQRDQNAEVAMLESEVARLKKLKEEAIQEKDRARQREIERQHLKEEAKLMKARIRKKQKEEALKRQQQAALEAESDAKQLEQWDHENEERKKRLLLQAKNILDELDKDITGGATIESAVSELKRIKTQRDNIYRDYSEELNKQSASISRFYDDKISRIIDIEPWDKEFETEADYNARLAEAETKAAPIRREKDQKLKALPSEIGSARDSLINPLVNQMKTLEDKRFSPASKVSFKFLLYKVKNQLMLGEVTFGGKTREIMVKIPKAKAREYKHNQILLTPEVRMEATLNGPKFVKAIFHGPENNEKYTTIADISNDGRFMDNGDGTVTDTKTGLMWANKDNGKDIDWSNAKGYCENYRGAGYTDWRMPTQDQLAGIYSPNTKNRYGQHVTKLINITDCCPWVSETRGSEAAYFSFGNGGRSWSQQSSSSGSRILAVRGGKR